jgi:chromosome segregation ATPase
MATTNELLQAKFNELQSEVAAIRDRTAPQRQRLRELADAQAAMQPEIDALSKEVHAHDGELFDKKRELATIAKALGGKSLSSGT